MKFSLGSLIGQALKDVAGLSHVHLPEGTSLTRAIEVVVAANSGRTTTPHYAFLISSQRKNVQEQSFPIVSSKESIRYRQGNHLAVVHGRQPDLSSFVQVFRPIFGQSFPDQANGLVSLERLAKLAIHELARELHGSEAMADDLESFTVLEDCLSTLRDLHSTAQDSVRAWNVVWFDHVDMGLASLRRLVVELRESGSDLSLGQAIIKFGPACFGLPFADRTGVRMASNASSARRLNEALEDFWSDSDKFAVSARRLPASTEPDGSHGPSLADINANYLTDLVSKRNNSWIGLAEFIGSSQENILAFSKLSEFHFKKPSGASDQQLRLALDYSGHPDLALLPTAPDSPFLIPFKYSGITPGRTAISEALVLRVPIARRPEAQDINPEEISATVRASSGYVWKTHRIEIEPEYINITGSIDRKLGTGKNAIPHQIITIDLDINSPKSISHLIPPDLMISAITFIEDKQFLILAAAKKNSGTLTTPRYLGPQNQGDAGQEFSDELRPSTNGYHAIVWVPQSNLCATIDGVQMQRHSVIPRILISKLYPTGDNEIVVQDYTFRIRSSSTGVGQQSALLAAALKQQVTPDRPNPISQSSIRGQAEEFFATKLSIEDYELTYALGHIVMPSDMSTRIEDVIPQDNGTILMGNNARGSLEQHNYASFQNDKFLRGPEASRMRQAIADLDFPKVLSRFDSKSGSEIEWPSRSSMRTLWGKPALQEYLDAYTALVDAARLTENEELVFWASYPMSVSVWDVTTTGGCVAVLLSPLHPIRLAWLAGVESVLFEADKSVDFMGSIEGWNIPLTGAGSKESRRMIAVPTDSGEGQLFLGWSMLVRAGTEEAEQIVSPRLIGSSTAPGSAVSGLNSTAVDAAMRSFRKMHPHISTLTVDLSAKDLQNRLPEIDETILKIAAEWGNTASNQLHGGIRVFDSVMRDGSAPRDEVTRIVRENRDLLLTWSRYDPSSKVSCNIRFLQGSGATIRVGRAGNKHGVLGNIPLRRFEGNSGTLDSRHLSSSEPGVALDMGWGPFTAALAAVEGGDCPPLVQAGMLRRDIDDVSADWTVLGESYLSPAVMADLMDRGTGGRMLWEWRPPIFDKVTGIPLMERRPFISIARVPNSFGAQLSDLLAKANGGIIQPELKKKVIAKLGSRGVGLSSLLSMGGTHVAGALGFYLAFELFDQIRSSSTNRFVIPIDAADYFLRTLAGGLEHGKDKRRADLLYIEIDDHEILLSPVEIKCYGLQTDNTNWDRLPDPTSSDLNESIDQLKASHKLFQAISEQSNEQKGADRVLWANSLATLVETAARLNPNSSGTKVQLAERLRKIVEGSMNVNVGRSILTYFKHDSRTSGGESAIVGTVGRGEFQADGLIADTSAVFSALKNESGGLLEEWSTLIKSGGPSTALKKSEGESTPSHGIQVDDSRESTEESVAVRDIQTANRSEADPADSDDARVNSPFSHEIKNEGVRFAIGKSLGSLGNSSVDFWPSNTGLNQLNIGIVGDLGTGKTELVKSLIAETRESSSLVQSEEPTSMLILDYKGDFQDQEFLDRVGGVVLQPIKIPLNIFLPETADYARKPYQQAAAFVDTLSRIYKNVGPVQSRGLNESIRELFAEKNGNPPTLAEVHERYSIKISTPDSVLSILDSFVFGEIFSDDKSSLKSFEDLLDGNVLVIALDKLGQDQRAKNALIALFLNLYYDRMIRSDKLQFQGESPQLRYLKSFLLIDEAVNAMRYDFEVLMNLMLQGRQFGVGVILASQYLSHFREGKLNFGQPLRTWFIHKVPVVTSRELEALGLPGIRDEVAKRIPELNQHEVLYKSFGWDDGRFVRVIPYYELFNV